MNITFDEDIRLNPVKDGVLYDYIFHYNHYTDRWIGVSRNNKDKYFNGTCDISELFISSDIKDVIKKIIANNVKSE